MPCGMGLFVVELKPFLSSVPAGGRVTPTRPYGDAVAHSKRYGRSESFRGRVTPLADSYKNTVDCPV